MPRPACSPSFALSLGVVATVLTSLAPALALSTVSAHPEATTLNVDSPLDEPLVLPPTGQCLSTPSGQCTLRAAIMLANRVTLNPVLINVPSGLYTLTIPTIGSDADNSGDLNITGRVPITLAGAGAATTIIDANQIDRVFSIGQGMTAAISGVTIRDGSAVNGPGSGIFNGGTLLLNNSGVSGNSTVNYGGGIFNAAATLTLTASTLSGNRAGISGGGSFDEGALTLNNSVISGNAAGNDAGGIYNAAASVSVTDTTISANTAGGDGGGIVNADGYFALARSTVYSNTAAVAAGGIETHSCDVCGSLLVLVNSTLSANRANTDGGGIRATIGADVRLYNATIAFNVADTDQNGSGSGGISILSSTVQLVNTILDSNLASDYDPDRQIWFAIPNECAGVLNSQGYNLISYTSSSCSISGDGTGNILNQSARLGLLQTMAARR